MLVIFETAPFVEWECNYLNFHARYPYKLCLHFWLQLLKTHYSQMANEIDYSLPWLNNISTNQIVFTCNKTLLLLFTIWKHISYQNKTKTFDTFCAFNLKVRKKSFLIMLLASSRIPFRAINYKFSIRDL